MLYLRSKVNHIITQIINVIITQIINVKSEPDLGRFRLLINNGGICKIKD